MDYYVFPGAGSPERGGRAGRSSPVRVHPLVGGTEWADERAGRSLFPAPAAAGAGGPGEKAAQKTRSLAPSTGGARIVDQHGGTRPRTRPPSTGIRSYLQLSPPMRARAQPRPCASIEGGRTARKTSGRPPGLAGAASTRPPGSLRAPGRRLPAASARARGGLLRIVRAGAGSLCGRPGLPGGDGPLSRPRLAAPARRRSRAGNVRLVVRTGHAPGPSPPEGDFGPPWRSPGGTARKDRAEPGTRNREAGRGTWSGWPGPGRGVHPGLFYILPRWPLLQGSPASPGRARTPETGGRPGGMPGNMRVRRRGLCCFDFAAFMNGPTGCRPGRVWAFWGCLAHWPGGASGSGANWGRIQGAPCRGTKPGRAKASRAPGAARPWSISPWGTAIQPWHGLKTVCCRQGCLVGGLGGGGGIGNRPPEASEATGTGTGQAPGWATTSRSFGAPCRARTFSWHC